MKNGRNIVLSTEYEWFSNEYSKSVVAFDLPWFPVLQAKQKQTQTCQNYPLRTWNNFPAGAGQVVRSNLFLLGHNPFLAGQISITSYLYKILPPPHPHMMFTYQTSTFSTPLLYMQPRTHCRKSGTHGVTAMFGKIIITFVHTNIASVPCLLYGEILIPTKVMKLMKLKLAM